MIPCVRPVCAALVVLAAVLSPPRAGAEPVTHRFVGQLTTITNGSGGMLDLTGLFTLGQAVTLDCTVERATTGVDQDAYVTSYSDAVTDVAFSIGGWSGGSAPSTSTVTVTNDQPFNAVHYDQYSWNALGVTAPPLGSVMLQTVTSTLDDIEGTVFDSRAIPRVFPALGVFDGKTATFLLIDFSSFKSGYVMATLSDVSTPAHGSTWGGIKALYRR
jgi:hypothetical protein